jgi:hypothetical protein
MMQFNDTVRPHTYRAEFKGNDLSLLIDNNKVLETVDNQFLDAGQIGLYNSGCGTQVNSFRIVAL